MATLVRYNSFRRLKKGNTNKSTTGLSSVDQIKEMEVFFNLLSKKKGVVKKKNNKS